MNRTFFQRINIYLKERFPLPLTVSSTLFGVIAMYLVWVATTPSAAFKFSYIHILAWLSYFLFTFILRLFDEIKDKDVDKDLFPERLLSRGEVYYSDIYLLLTITLFIWIPLNYLYAGSQVVFTFLCIYGFLFLKYFFIPEILSKNILLALISHNPVMFIASYYICTIFSADQGLDKFTANNFLIALVFWMPSIVWESGRKIKVPSEETQYQTYSKFLGTQTACLIPFIGLFIQALSLQILASGMNFSLPLRSIVWGLFGVYMAYLFIFLLTMNKNMAHDLQKVTEAQILIFSLTVALISALEIWV